MSVVLEGFPFDNVETNGVNDREYTASIFAGYFKKFLTNGVYYGDYKDYKENSMKVTANDSLTVTVAPRMWNNRRSFLRTRR